MYLGARSQEKLDWAASSIRTAGGAVETFVADVLDEYGTSK
ncbi:short-chain dehydrogenase, partial [Citrobacter braakii]